VQALAARHYDIVHYVGFGRFDVPADRLALEPARLAAPGYVNADDFASCFEDAAPRLVVLQAARAGEEVPADLGTFAPPLLMRGGDGVVASQYPVSGSLTVRFNDAMYAALADGAALEMAVQAARKSIWTSAAETRAFLSPAVFLKRPGGLRLTDRRERASRSRVGVLSSHA